MKTQTVQIEWHEGSPTTDGEHLIQFANGYTTQRYWYLEDAVDDYGQIKHWANPIEYKTDEINAVELLEQAARELGGLIHLFNIRAKNDDVELLDFQTVDELQQLAVKITLNKLGQ